MTDKNELEAIFACAVIADLLLVVLLSFAYHILDAVQRIEKRLDEEVTESIDSKDEAV